LPNIYDNIDKHLVDALRDAMTDATRLDVCVGYFNLRGWREPGVTFLTPQPGGGDRVG
jgi:hypothetical protein